MKNKVKLIAEIVRYLILIILALCIGVSFYYVLAANLGGNNNPLPFGVGASVVLSGSMEPAIGVDDIIIIRKMDDYQPGDIIVYRSGRSSVVHRLISVEGDVFITQGDANNTCDAPISRWDVLGRVVKVIPRVGWVIKYIRTPFGTIFFIILSVLYIEFSFSHSRKRKENEKAELMREIEELRVSNDSQKSEDSEK